MPIIGKVGRKSTKVKILNITIHLILILGAVTMVYPFMMMISASFKSNVDSIHFSLYPEFFTQDEILFKKFIEARYNEESNQMIENYKNRFLSFDQLRFPDSKTQLIYQDWKAFLQERSNMHDGFDYYIAEQFGRGIYPRNEREFRNLMKKESGNDLAVFNQTYDASVRSWDEVRIEEKDILSRNFTGDYSGYLARYMQFRKELPLWNRIYASADGGFLKNELIPAYKNDLRLLNSSLNTDYKTWDEIVLTKDIDEGALKNHWENYVKYQLNLHQVSIKKEAIDLYQAFLKEKYETTKLLNETYKSSYQNFETIEIPEDFGKSGARFVDLSYFVERILPTEMIEVSTVEFEFRDWLKKKYIDISALNDAYQLGYEDFNRIDLPLEYPDYSIAKQDDWVEFVKQYAPLKSIKLLSISQSEFIDYLKRKYPGDNEGIDLAEVNRILGKNYRKVLNIYPAEKAPDNKSYLSLWQDFVENDVSGKFIQLSNAKLQHKWRDFLQSKYESITALNSNWGLIYDSFDNVRIDSPAIDYELFNEHKHEIFWEFVKRNYVMVLDLMLYNGRAVVNTLIYCFLAIVTALIVNPLAAYAMSRFKLRATYKILLVLMLTMAFPPMVMGIPNFLLLKRFNMLNTFFALILPAAADGYFIFLLKGFFDSLPKELFESATMDGAGEVRIFWQIAMSLSKPIMAVIALGAFNAAYRNFMFAFIVCQDKSMWTMMVHIYQLIQRSSPGVGFAALVIAAIPTFAVFVFFQNIIIRGIVVPTEK